jgi:hypothetical protein
MILSCSKCLLFFYEWKAFKNKIRLVTDAFQDPPLGSSTKLKGSHCERFLQKRECVTVKCESFAVMSGTGSHGQW